LKVGNVKSQVSKQKPFTEQFHSQANLEIRQKTGQLLFTIYEEKVEDEKNGMQKTRWLSRDTLF